MGSAAVIVINVLLALSAFCAWKWRSEYKRARFAINHAADLDKLLTTAGERNAQLEAEILRLRNNSLTPPPEKVDNSVIKAKSSADVRRLTEAAFGVQPEIGEHLENE